MVNARWGSICYFLALNTPLAYFVAHLCTPAVDVAASPWGHRVSFCDSVATVVLRSTRQFATRIPGGDQVPSPSGKIDGGISFGQYSRMTTNMGPFGAGSQFDSFALPGESFWM